MELKTIDLGGGIGRVVLSAPIKNHERECSDCGQPAIYRFFEVEVATVDLEHVAIHLKTGNEEYRRGDVHTNSIESVWAVLKRGIHGTFHHVSKKHLNRYVQEFAFRLSDGKVENHTWVRMDALVKMVAGKRITYSELTKENV
jgi:hypothetical protein